MLAPLLALGSAILYGAADFLGGLAARRTNIVAVVGVSQCAGLAVLAVMLPVLPAAAPTTADLLHGAAAGVAVSGGLALLYRALAVGRMAVVAPTTAVCAVVIPVVAAMLLGERPSPRIIAGIALAIVSIVLVSQQPTAAAPRAAPRSGLGLALLSGVAIGVFFLLLSRAAPAAGLWPLLPARAVAVAAYGLAALAGRQSLWMARRVAVTVTGAGVLDVLANALYLLATHHGPLSVVATLAALYPASTVVLALAVLGERLSLLQGAGIACALVAVFLVVGR